MEISIVVPIYNVAKNAVEHIPSIIEMLKCKYKDFELLFIIDNIVINEQIQALLTLSKRYSEIKVSQLNNNYGQHFATLCGYYLAKGDFIVCIDEDMTKYLCELCNHHEYQQHDVFYFYYNKNDMYRSNIRRFFSNTYKHLINKVVNLKKHSTYRIISKSLRDKILSNKHIFWNIDVMIFNNTNDIGSATLYLPDISDEDSVYNYKKLSAIAFEIAYEHNTILMNTIFASIVSYLLFFTTQNIRLSLLFFAFLLFLTTASFKILKHKSLTTIEKISNALS